jgi:hypothetical protein
VESELHNTVNKAHKESITSTTPTTATTTNQNGNNMNLSGIINAHQPVANLGKAYLMINKPLDASAIGNSTNLTLQVNFFILINNRNQLQEL